MRIKELHAGLSGTIPLANYENLKPSFNITIEPEEGETAEDCFLKLKKILREQFDSEANQARIDFLEKQYRNIRFREKNGRKYPSVTSITGFDKDWKISDDELRQYASRGTVVHRLIEEYIKTGKWVEPETLSELKEDLIILVTGSLKLSWKDCSYEKFFQECGKDFEFIKTEVEVFNDEVCYSGRFDALVKYKGKLSIADWKTGNSFCHSQTAAYAVAYKDRVDNLIICPVGSCPNKTGYFKPNITEDIKGNYQKFLKDRAKFRQRFGI
jgi:hypothetical protein